MPHNRSCPTDVVLPHLCYEDVAAAVAWLSHNLGFVEHYHYGNADIPDGAQLHRGECWIMVNRPREGRATPRQAGANTQILTVFVDAVDELYDRLKAGGSTMIEELNETHYGDRQFVVEDPEGHRWIVSQHVKDVSPEQWGAFVAKH